MLPEETVQAHRDVQGGVLLPVHWAGFTLALHDWNDPARRVSAAADEQRISYRIPRIGEAVYLEQPVAQSPQQDDWWRDLEERPAKASDRDIQASSRPV